VYFAPRRRVRPFARTRNHRSSSDSLMATLNLPGAVKGAAARLRSPRVSGPTHIHSPCELICAAVPESAFRDRSAITDSATHTRDDTVP
jgi:hypothetical protein